MKKFLIHLKFTGKKKKRSDADLTLTEDMAPKNVDGEEKSKPRAKQYRTHGLVHYQLLEEIFNTTTATGQLHYASNQLPPNSDEELELENNFLNTSVYIDVDLDDDGVNLETDHGKGKRKSVTATHRAYESKLQTIQKKKSVEASSTSKEMYSIEECIGIVEEIGDIDNDTFNKMVLDMSTSNGGNNSDSDSDMEELEEIAHHMLILTFHHSLKYR
ncbi:hypothetical protein Prudu_017217 [Prunus dulcis]|uniref:Uncharacterized protein n=1 Tax=Prunus dulcis TaxID=3755 RepID=A0A4Y1RP89_PRUDU|nr:hypothetical protein Prudu_017217 [Prunus dulcis]